MNRIAPRSTAGPSIQTEAMPQSHRAMKRFGFLQNASRSNSYAVALDLAEFQLLEVNGKSIGKNGRWKDAATFMNGVLQYVIVLLPGDGVKLYARFGGFRGKYLMHCINGHDQGGAARWDVI